MRRRLLRRLRTLLAPRRLMRAVTLLVFATATIGVRMGVPTSGCCCGEERQSSGTCCCVKSVAGGCCGTSKARSCCGGLETREKPRPALAACTCGGESGQGDVLVNGDPRLAGTTPVVLGCPAMSWQSTPSAARVRNNCDRPLTPPPEAVTA